MLAVAAFIGMFLAILFIVGFGGGTPPTTAA